MKLYFSLFFSLMLFAFSTTSSAVQIVRIQVDYNGAPHNLDLELFDTKVGPTVANFLSYVNDGRYNGTFIYRAVPGFVVQTGGYTFRPADPFNDGLRPISEPGSGLALVPKNNTIVLNDPSVSNTRGTLALAKVSNSPDSGSSEWFINLDDNSKNLDNQNGGFTVFGSVIDDGMVIADEISAFPIQSFASAVLGSAFSALPVVNYNFITLPPPLVLKSNLVMLSNFTIIDRPIIRLSPSIIDFSLDNATDGLSKIISTVIKNTGNEILDIGTITNLSAPFNISADTCSGATLVPESINPASTCTVDLEFSATAIGVFNTSVTIPYTSQVNAATFSVSYSLTGEGVPATPVVDPSVTDLTFTDTIRGTTSNETIVVRNRGDGILIFNSLNLTGTDSNQYTIDTLGCMSGTTLTINQTCNVIVTFSPDSAGLKNATLEINTNAGISNITLNGSATQPVLNTSLSTINLSTQLNQTTFDLITISNTGTGSLLLNNITITGTGASAFSQQNNCANTNNSGTPTASLNAGEACTLQIIYSPVDGSSKSATIVIESNDPATPSVNISLSGIIADPFISTASSFDLGSVEINAVPSTKELIITNTGLAPLVISSISGFSNADFSLISNCTGLNVQVSTNATCSIFITYTPSTLGASTDVITIVSNDPVTPSINVNVSGFGTSSAILDPLISTTNTLNLGTTEIGGASSVKEVIITNRGLAPLVISGISGLTNADFSQTNNCTGIGVQLALDASCSITVTYTASTLGSISDTLTIASNDPAKPSINVNITGSGVDNVIENPFISTVRTLNLGTAQINGTPSIKQLIITNRGIAPLVISSISGLNNAGFSQVNNCVGTNVQISTNATCSIFIRYATTTLGAATDILTITSNDPVKQSINIDINGYGGYDTDGIPGNVELSGPNSGDANNDGVSDEIQNNVATLIALDSNYITFISDKSITLNSETSFSNVSLINTIPTGKPTSAAFDLGLYGYTIMLPNGDGVNMAILLPANEKPTTFYKYGPTPDNTSDHWYNFSYDETTATGAKFLGRVTYAGLQKNLVIVSYVDGQRGDDDLKANAVVLNNISGLSLAKVPADSGSSAGSITYLHFFMLFVLRILRNKTFLKKQIFYLFITK